MFNSVSKQIYAFFSEMPEFQAVMQREVEGELKTFLFPIVASETNSLPLATYVLDERTPETKDRSQLNISIAFWFDKDSYDDCCIFTDAMVLKVDDEFNLISSSIEYNEESYTYSGLINFNLL